MPPSLSAGSYGKNSSSWMTNSLTTFWQGVNWENLPPSTPSYDNLIDRHLSVRNFFQSIPWVITTTAAPLVSDSNDKEAQDTLNDFLQDISAFF